MAALRLSSFVVLILGGFFALTTVVFGLQPNLPTSLYGQITQADGTPALNTKVTATWTDSNGNQKSVATTTISDGYQNLNGYYFFTQGYLLAAEGSQITVEAGGISKSVPASPGGSLQLAESIVVGSKGSGQAGASGTAGSGGDPSSSQGSGSGPGDGSGDCGENCGTVQSGIQGIGGQGSGSGEFTNISSSQKPTQASGANKPFTGPVPKMPTTIYGQYLDEEGDPLGGEEVIAEWIDEKNQFHSVATKTLTKKEAKQLGNESLEGFFSFNEGNINPKVDTFIEVKSSRGNVRKPIPPQPGESVKTDLQSLAAKQSEVEKPEPEIKMNISTYATQFIEVVKETGRYKVPLLGFIIILLGIFVSIRYQKHLKKGMNTFMEDYAVSQFHRQMSRLGKIRLKEVMSKKVVTAEKKDSILDLLHSIMTNNIGSLVVMDGKRPCGLVTERDILRKVELLLKSGQPLTVEHFMSSPIQSLGPDDSVLDAVKFAMKMGVRKVPVIKGKQLVGIVTLTDIARVFEKIFSKLFLGDENIPVVKVAMTDKALLARKEENLVYVIKFMLKSKADAVIVVNEEVSDSGEKNEVLGIITERDLLGEWQNNPERFAKLRVEEITNTKMFTVIPGSSLLEANKIMIEKNVRRLVVVVGQQPVAILTQKDVIRVLYDLYQKMAKGKINKAT